MRLKIFCCPECVRGRRFASLAALNIHIGKNHNVPYKIILKNNIPYIKRKAERAQGAYIKEIVPSNERL